MVDKEAEQHDKANLKENNEGDGEREEKKMNKKRRRFVLFCGYCLSLSLYFSHYMDSPPFTWFSWIVTAAS